MNISNVLLPMLGMTMFGGIILCLGLLLLGEYRDAFLRDPRAMITLDVITRVGGGSGPGYLATLLMFVGALFIVAGLAVLLLLVGIYVIEMFSPTGKH